MFAEVAGLTGSPITITVLKQAGPATDATADSGAAQTGAPAETLPAALVVLIEDQYGNGVFGMDVDWIVTVGDGSLSQIDSVTDGNGRSRAVLTLGSAGPHTVTATVVGFTGSPVVFNATAMTARP